MKKILNTYKMKNTLKRPFAGIKYATKGMSYKDYLLQHKDQVLKSDVEFDRLGNVRKGFNYSD